MKIEWSLAAVAALPCSPLYAELQSNSKNKKRYKYVISDHCCLRMISTVTERFTRLYEMDRYL